MNFDDMNAAVNHAKSVMTLADRFTDQMAGIVVGRLQSGSVRHSTLKQMKQELANYNIHTGKWKEPK